MIPESKVFLMDCLEGMKSYPDKYFDLAIVDPPYGIGNFIPQNVSKTGTKISKEVFWNNEIPENKYFNELVRVSENQIIWGANYYNCFPISGGALVWYKGQINPIFSQCEIASISFQTKVDYCFINWQAGFHRINKEGEQVHPCQKPVQLYKWLLKNYAKPGDKILDTHLGSGSSRIAAYDMGFDFTAYEIDPEYYEAQERRFNQFKNQLTLFTNNIELTQPNNQLSLL